MTANLTEAFQYNKWANLRLLDACASLSSSQLQLTAPGTYGTIAATLQHLMAAEQRYLWRLGGDDAGFSEHDEFRGIAQLSQDADQSGNRLIDAAGRLDGDAWIETTFRNQSVRLRPRVILLQALHHGNDHRTHVCTVLGANGIECGDLDVWAYGAATGELMSVSANA
jgi:uncharacterized damage-inducible protein DinB